MVLVLEHGARLVAGKATLSIGRLFVVEQRGGPLTRSREPERIPRFLLVSRPLDQKPSLTTRTMPASSSGQGIRRDSESNQNKGKVAMNLLGSSLKGLIKCSQVVKIVALGLDNPINLVSVSYLQARN